MWAYDDGRGRRSRDAYGDQGYYYDDIYDRPSAPSRYQDPPGESRHRRKSVPVNYADNYSQPQESRSTRRASRADDGRGVHVLASDDGSDSPYGRAQWDPYAANTAGASRHDAEYKTSDTNKQFRQKRGHYDVDEGAALRGRAKSYSPRRAAREAAASAPRAASPPAPKSPWPDADYPAERQGHRSSKKGRGGGQDYFGDPDPWAAYRQQDAQPALSRGKSRDDRGGTAAYNDYAATGPGGLPRPPIGGDHAPYRSSPLTSIPDDRPSKHKRREKPYYQQQQQQQQHQRQPQAYADDPYASAYNVDPDPPRRTHSRRGRDLNTYADPAPPQSNPRGRHAYRQPPPAAGGDDYGLDPYASAYDRAPPPPQPRHHRDRQSMPPRSRYDNPYGEVGRDDPYAAAAAPPRRRASVSARPDRYDGYPSGGDPYARGRQLYEDRYASPNGGRKHGGGGGKKKSKGWQKEAGALFVTHALPVIKKEAVPLLTKAAQAYFDQRR